MNKLNLPIDALCIWGKIPRMIIYIILSLSLTIIPFLIQAQNDTCANADPFCSDSGISFPANSDGTGSGSGPQADVLDPGNDYGCLGTTGNPAWFYMEVGVAGTIDITLTNSNTIDIDYALWGPFANIATATANCGSLPAPIDCGYTTAATEIVNVPNSSSGQVYLMVVTNYANEPTNISAAQTGGTGDTDCTIVPPCNTDVGTFVISPNSTNIVLCQGESWSIISDNNFELPPGIDNPGPNNDSEPELMYAVYNCAPPANPDPEVDVCFSGLFWTGQDFTAADPGGTNSNALGGIPDALANAGITGTNDAIWYIPVTADDGDNDNNNTLGINNNDDGCLYDVGTPVQITYLEVLEFTSVSTCDNSTGTGTVDVTITGGLAPYSLTDTGDGSLSTTSIPASGGTVTINVSDDDNFSFDIVDANGCTSTVSGTFNCNIVVTSPCENTTVTSIPDNTGVPGSSSILNSGSVGTLGAGTEIVEVCVLIDHTFIGDLFLQINLPSGTGSVLSSYNGGATEDYGDVTGNVEVCFTPNATNSITGYTGGQTGSFLPQTPFSNLDGENPNGIWTLNVWDDAGGDTGSIISWSMTFSNGDCAVPCIIDNEECTAPSIISLVSGVESCVDGCTIGATDDSSILGNGCGDIVGAAVWYEITTVDYALLIEAESSDIPDIQLQLWTDCGTYLAGGCETGSGGIANILSAPGTGETYLLSVSSASGTEGQFELCVTSFPDPSPCNIDNVLTANPPATDFPNDMYPPGTTVEFCYTINEFQKANCNYLQGIVPTWGDCWSLASGSEPTTTTPLVTAGNNLPNGAPDFGASSGNWSWFNDGDVLYNDIPNGSLPVGSSLGAGWFFLTTYDSYIIENGVANPDPTDPDNSYGDGYIGGVPENNCDVALGAALTWTVCFELTTNSLISGCTNQADCSVSIKTYGDGEIGVWDNEGCYLDVATIEAASQCCVDPVTLTNDSECEGNTVTINSGYIGMGTVNWYDVATDGAPIGTGLDYTTSVLTPGTYTFYAEVEEEGCLSTRASSVITILPLPSVTFNDFPKSLCLGESITMIATVADGTIANWSGEGTSGTSNTQVVSPTSSQTYSITLNSSLGCDPVTVLIPITIYPEVLVDAGSDLTLCEGQTAYLGALASGGLVTTIDDYTYNWDNSLGAGKSHTVLVGSTDITYTVTVTDLNSCTATDQITILSTTDDPPMISCPSNQNVSADADCEANVTLVDPTVTDDCAPPTLTASNGVILNYYGFYNGHYYYVTAQNLTPISNDPSGIPGTSTELEAFDAVQAAAQEFGTDGYIATIDNLAENTFITNVGYHYGNVIIGANDNGTEGTFVWEGACGGCGGTGSGYFNWNAGEPNNAGGEDYVELQVANEGWNDIDLILSIREAVVEFNTIPEDVTVSCSPGNPFSLGTTTVTCTATDWANNMNSCTYDIVVTDNADPTITCPANVTVNVCDNPITIAAPTIMDNCPGVTAINDFNSTADASDTYPVGTTTVIWTVSDVAGNTETCSMTVTVTDNPIGLKR